MLMGHIFFFLCPCGSGGLILPLSLFLSPCLSPHRLSLFLTQRTSYFSLGAVQTLSLFRLYFYQTLFSISLRTTGMLFYKKNLFYAVNFLRWWQNLWWRPSLNPWHINLFFLFFQKKNLQLVDLSAPYV